MDNKITNCPIKKALDNDMLGSLVIVLIGFSLVAVLTWLNVPTNIVVLIIGIGIFGLFGLQLSPMVKDIYDYFKNKKKKDDDS